MINIIKVISTEIIAKGRRAIKVLRLGKQDIQTSLQAAPFGSDTNPPANLRAVYLRTGVKGDQVVVGFINLDQVAEVGENRQISTDPDGNLIFEARMRNDGTYEIGGSVDNLIRFAKMQAAFNELRGDLNALITAYNSHIHITTATVGGTPVLGIIAPTVSTGTPSAADMTDAKIAELKTS